MSDSAASRELFWRTDGRLHGALESWPGIPSDLVGV